MAFMDYPTPIDDGTMAAAPSGVAPTAAPGVDPVAALMQQAAAAKRKQDLAQLLLQHAGSQGSQGQMMGGIYVPPSPLSPINKAMAELGGVYAAKKGWDSQDALSSKLLQAKSDQITQMMANPDTADRFIASPDPTTAKLAETIVKNREERAKSTITNADGNLVAVNPFTQSTKKLGYYGPTYTPPYNINGDLYTTQIESGKPDQLNKAQRTTITLPEDKTARNHAIEVSSKWLDENRGVTTEAPKTIAALQRSKQLLSEGTLKGTLAPVQAFVGQTIASLGGQAGAKVTNTTEYKAQMAPLLIEILRKFAPVTDPDRQYAEKMTATDASSMTDAAAMRLIDAAEKWTRVRARQYDDTRQEYGKIMANAPDADFSKLFPVVETLPPEVPTPPPSDASGGEDLSTPEGRLAAARARGLIK